MKITIRTKYLLALPPIASITTTYLAWSWIKVNVKMKWHETFELGKEHPESFTKEVQRSANNENLLLVSFLVVVACWFTSEPQSITNIFTHTIGTWLYTACDIIANAKAPKV